MFAAFAFSLLLALADPLAGEWAMNLAKSRFGPSAVKLESQTMTCRPRGIGIRCLTDRKTAAGERTRSEFMAHYDGKEYPVTGNAEVTGVILERLKPAVVRATFTKTGRPVFAYRMVISADRRILTITSIDPQTKEDLTSAVIYERTK